MGGLQLMASTVTRDHHSLRRNLKLNGNYISNDGGDEGISITDAGVVTASPNQLTIDRNVTTTSAGTYTAVDIDFDKTGTSTSDNTMYGLKIDIDNTTATDGTNTMYGLYSTPTLYHAADAGTPTVVGGYFKALGTQSGTSASHGIIIDQQTQFFTSDTASALTIREADQTFNYFSMSLGLYASTTITTVNGGENTLANLIFNIDGFVTINSASDKPITLNAGTDLTINAGGDVVLDADGDQVSMKFGGATGQIDFSNENSGDGVIRQMIDAKDLVIQQFDGSEVIRIADDRKLYFYDKGGEHISSDGTDLTIASGNDCTLDAEGDIKLDAQGGNITLLDGGSTYTPSATSDATTKAYVDGQSNTTKAYVDGKYFFSQRMTYSNRMSDYDAEWLLINNESYFKLGGTDTSVDDTETATISEANKAIAQSLWFIVPFNMTITHISGVWQDDEFDNHPSGAYHLGLWVVASIGTSGSTPTSQTGSKTFTLKYITPTISPTGTESAEQLYAFYDTSPTLTLSAGDAVWAGAYNTRNTSGNDSTLSMSIWGYAT